MSGILLELITVLRVKPASRHEKYRKQWQMVWKMLLMNDEKKRLWPPLPFTLFVLYYLPCIRQPSHHSLMFYISANHGYVTCIGADPPVRRWRVSAGDGCHSFD